MFFYVFFCNIIKVKYFLYYFTIIMPFIFPFLHAKSLLIPCAYFSIKSINYILLSPFEFKAILLFSSNKVLCFSLLNPSCLFKITFLYFVISLRLSALVSFYSKYFSFLSILAAFCPFL